MLEAVRLPVHGRWVNAVWRARRGVSAVERSGARTAAATWVNRERVMPAGTGESLLLGTGVPLGVTTVFSSDKAELAVAHH